MKIKYCLPIIKSRKDAVITAIEKNKSAYDYFEIWLDYIEDITPDFIESIQNTYKNKLIFLFRRQNLEREHMEETMKKTLLNSLEKTHACIDVDVEKQKELLKVVKQLDTISLITSYHEYSHTPNDDVISAIVETMNSYAPTIYKISTYCKSPEDAVRLLTLICSLKKENKRCIILGMGKHGMITRIFGTLWGNEMIFAPQIEHEASAPGQLTKQQLDTIFATLQRKEQG